MNRAIAATALSLIHFGVGVSVASADPVDPDPFGYKDRTSYFVTPLDPGAFGANADKSIILSPYGTRHGTSSPTPPTTRRPRRSSIRSAGDTS